MYYVSQKNWNKIIGYAEEAYETQKSEIGGMSVMVKDKDGDWELQHPVILEQEISAGNTVLDKEALAVYYTREAKKMGKQDFRFCWWHSHHTMQAFWSGTDLTAIDEYNGGDFSFALVVNLKGEYKFRVSVWNPVELHQDTILEIMRPNLVTKNMKKEVEDLCSKHTHTYSWKNPNIDYNRRDIGYHQERLPFNGYNTDSSVVLYPKKTSYSEIVDSIDDLNGEMVEGTISYKEYAGKVDIINEKLIKEESLYKVDLLPESQIQNLLYSWPGQMVKYKATDTEVYDETFYDGGY